MNVCEKAGLVTRLFCCTELAGIPFTRTREEISSGLSDEHGSPTFFSSRQKKPECFLVDRTALRHRDHRNPRLVISSHHRSDLSTGKANVFWGLGGRIWENHCRLKSIDLNGGSTRKGKFAFASHLFSLLETHRQWDNFSGALRDEQRSWLSISP